MSEQKVEELVLEYENLRRRLAELNSLMQLLSASLSEIQMSLETLSSLENLSEETSLLAPAGTLILVPVRYKPLKKILVNTGAGYYIEMGIEEAKRFVENRGRVIRELLNRASLEARNVMYRMKEIEDVIRAKMAGKQGRKQ